MLAPRDANKWDVEAQDNRLDGLLVSIKCIEWKRSIYLGDMVRQFNINTDFRLIVGFWKGRKDNIVQVVDCVIRQQD